MERRREARIQPVEEFLVTVLGEGHASMVGSILDMSKHGLSLRLPAAVPTGTPIKVELEDALVLGEVSYCRSQNGEFRVGLVVKHRLAGLAELYRLNHALHAAVPVSLYGEPSSIIEK